MAAHPAPVGDPVDRAHAAYYAHPWGDVLDQPSRGGELVTHEGKQYVVLSNSHRTLAVYRVRPSGQLKRLRRWPVAVAD
jgi:hypothetical protein